MSRDRPGMVSVENRRAARSVRHRCWPASAASTSSSVVHSPCGGIVTVNSRPRSSMAAGALEQIQVSLT